MSINRRSFVRVNVPFVLDARGVFCKLNFDFSTTFGIHSNAFHSSPVRVRREDGGVGVARGNDDDGCGGEGDYGGGTSCGWVFRLGGSCGWVRELRIYTRRDRRTDRQTD